MLQSACDVGLHICFYLISPLTCGMKDTSESRNVFQELSFKMKDNDSTEKM